MRYKRRGVDTDGHVANYVETEQLIHVHSHTLSFVQTRGSVPVFWSQAGYRYNPRPRLEKGQWNNIITGKCLIRGFVGGYSTFHSQFIKQLYLKMNISFRGGLASVFRALSFGQMEQSRRSLGRRIRVGLDLSVCSNKVE